MFIDEQQFTSYEVISMSNGLSDHEVQLFTAHLPVLTTLKNEVLIKRNINDHNIAEFKMKLNYENWESVFNNNDINTSFNQFLNILLRYFYELFSKTARHKYKHKSWITTSIKISCKNKRILYDEVKKCKNPTLYTYYKNYCKILNRVINQAKKMSYEKQIKYSGNKVRMTNK
jgi:hypothetical protein